MWSLWHTLIKLFQTIFGGLRNPQKKPAELSNEDLHEIIFEPPAPSVPRRELPLPEVDETADTPPLEKIEPGAVPVVVPAPELTIHEKIAAILAASDWDPPLERLPRSRAEMYSMLGDPGKGKVDKAFERKYLFIANKLPGHWNKGSQRLFIHKFFEPYLRMALYLVETILGEVPLERLGCFNFRHIRFNPALALSYHSWAAAVDGDHVDNRAIYRYSKWQKKANESWKDCPPAQATRGPVTLPFDSTWILTWPKGFSYEFVCCFLAVGLTWGATWSFEHSRWMYFVDKYGVGYEPSKMDLIDKDLYRQALAAFQKVTFVDNMHFEIQDRQPRSPRPKINSI